MVVGEEDVVTLEIIGDPLITDTGVISIEKRSVDGDRIVLTDTIKISSVMSATLKSTSFEVAKDDHKKHRYVDTSTFATWSWNIISRDVGLQTFTIDIYEEETKNGEKFPKLLKSKSRNISVLDKSLDRKIWDGISNNLLVIVSAGGPIALFFSFLTLWLNQKKENGTRRQGAFRNSLLTRIVKNKPQEEIHRRTRKRHSKRNKSK